MHPTINVSLEPQYVCEQTGEGKSLKMNLLGVLQLLPLLISLCNQGPKPLVST